ncbi:MAG: cupin domain-containing protein [Bdellovibrionales bacterium]|nr:cupin domain-containing protein [Bdellovibrionales bacterium]
MKDTSVKKVQARTSPRGALGQKYLASGKRVSLRLWEELETEEEVDRDSCREYETVGYCLAGSATLHLEGQVVKLERGDSWVVPAGAHHRYSELQGFSAVEATAPPAQVHGRDEGAAGAD